MSEFTTKEGRSSLHLAVHKGVWIKPSMNPFGYGCGNCGAYYQVEYMIKGEELFLRFVLDEDETQRLQKFIMETEDTVCTLRRQR